VELSPTAHAPNGDAEAQVSAVKETEKPLGWKLCAGMIQDLKRRAPHYVSDWKDGLHPKVIASTLFMFFTSIAPAITFAAVLNTNTRVGVDPDVPKSGVAQLGPVEVLLSTAITGTIFAIFGGQPMCILGVTGPVTIFTLAVFTIASALDLPFLEFYAWIQIWAALMHVVIAMLNLCDLIRVVTRFSCETFGTLIATIYLYNGIRNLALYFVDKDLTPALLSLILGLGCAWLALLLAGARSWSLGRKWIRVLIADYGATISIVLFCLVPYMGEAYTLTPDAAGGESAATIATLDVPSGFETTSGRESWFVNPMGHGMPGWGIALALVPAAILTVLFFFDHNVSSLLCQQPEFGLKKGSAYHWDFFIVGINILVTGLLGIPPVNGLIPQAPLHTDSLCEKAFVTDSHGNKVERVVSCNENRISNLMQAVLIGCTLAAIKLIGMLPIAALDGLFIYMGIASFAGNTFYERVVLYITDKDLREARRLPFIGKDFKKVPLKTIHLFTLLQFFILACIFVITLLDYVDCLFPVLIAVLVPVRIYYLPRLFGKEAVDILDAAGTGAAD